MSQPAYPWQSAIWQSLLDSQKEGRLAHALLISGVPGVGRKLLAQTLAARLLCAHGRSCGDCPPCHWVGAGSHPDFHHLEPLEDKRTVVVDQVRALIAKLSLSSLAGGRKVAIIQPAEAMTEGAANCLLKTLEEPLGDSVIMLVADQRVALPATIVSRCQKVPVRLPRAAESIRWLEERHPGADWPSLLRLAGGAPLAALSMRDDAFVGHSQALGRDLAQLLAGRTDPASAAERWLKIGPERCLDWLAGLVCDVIRLKFGVAEPELAHSLTIEGLPHHINQIKFNSLFRYLDEVRVGRRRLETPLNPQLIVETLLIPWASRFAPA